MEHTKHAQEIDLLLTLSIRHVNHALVTLGSAHMSQSDSSVTGSSFNNGASGLDES
jgi:hypothetical protein